MWPEPLLWSMFGCNESKRSASFLLSSSRFIEQNSDKSSECLPGRRASETGETIRTSAAEGVEVLACSTIEQAFCCRETLGWTLMCSVVFPTQTLPGILLSLFICNSITADCQEIWSIRLLYMDTNVHSSGPSHQNPGFKSRLCSGLENRRTLVTESLL